MNRRAVTLKSVLVATVVVAFAGTAAAHTPVPSLASAPDLRFESTAPDRVQSLSLFSRSNAVAELTRLELPPPLVAEELAEKLAVSAKLASGPRRFALQSKSSDWSELGGKTWWGKENKGAPFVEPATGLVYFRERWLDPSTGTWLTPDPVGYADSSNLYAAFRNDPVNLSDPRGEAVPALLVAGALYLGWTLFNAAVDVGMDRLLMGDDEFDINASIGMNVSVNALTGGWGGKLSKLKHLRRLSRFGQRAVGEGAEYAVDVGATGSLDMLLYDHGAAEAYGTAAIGGAITRGAGYGLSYGFEGISRSRTREIRRSRKSTLSMGGEFVEDNTRIIEAWPVMKNAIVLGHSPDYIEAARAIGARRFQVSDDLWQRLDDDGRWALNQAFLDDAISRNSEIILATPLEKMSPRSIFYKREIKYLRSMGFEITQDGTRMIRVGAAQRIGSR